MAKDPAALLYIDKYLIATAEMDSDCVGWYTKLILHQYDKGSLPNDVEKLASLCNVRFSEFKRFKQVFEQVLKKKFKQNENNRLEQEFASEIIKKREIFKNKRSNAGKWGYAVKFIKKHFSLKKAEIEFLKENLKLEFDLKNEQVFKQMVEQTMKLFINVDKDKDKTINKIPTFEDFKSYSISKVENIDLEKLKLKYESWKENNWKDGNNNQIKNWKSKILNTLPYLKQNNKQSNNSSFSVNR